MVCQYYFGLLFSPLVHGVFENVATKYDLMNDLMSIGIHRLWKDIYVETVNPIPGSKILDVAGGTGLLVSPEVVLLQWFRLLRRYRFAFGSRIRMARKDK